MRLRKPAAPLLPLAMLAVVGAGCLPKPDDPVEYLAREDAVIVQMLNVSGLPQPELFDRLTLPDFTLYGDGTLVYTDPGQRGSSAADAQLLQAQVPGNAVQDLLAFIEGRGFFDFQYEQPRPDRVFEDATRSYVYAQTKLAANASTATGLDLAGEVDASGSEFAQYRRLAEIKRRLDEFDPEAVGGRVLGEFEGEAFALIVQPLDAEQAPAAAEPWPVDGIDLASVTPQLGSNVAVRYVTPTEAAPIMAALPSGHGKFEQAGRYFDVAYRVALPFEEDGHLPEFDLAGMADP